jgi:hypothetical protein
MSEPERPFVAIMQPTYLPWIGYLAMIDLVDTFIFLDTVQFEKRSWQQRNRIKSPNGPIWLTVPVHTKGAFDQAISSVRIDRDRKFAEKHLASLQGSYGKTPFFQDGSARLFGLIRDHNGGLADLNIGLIRAIADWLGVETRILRASDMDNKGHKADLLAHLAIQAGAKTYVSAPGSMDYLSESDAFDNCGIDVRYQAFEHPIYRQRFGEFEPYMSIVDILFNEGPDRTRELMRAGVRLAAAAELENRP